MKPEGMEEIEYTEIMCQIDYDNKMSDEEIEQMLNDLEAERKSFESKVKALMGSKDVVEILEFLL